MVVPTGRVPESGMGMRGVISHHVPPDPFHRNWVLPHPRSRPLSREGATVLDSQASHG